MEQYKEILENRDIKPTFQRLKILGYLKENKTHPTIDHIYDDLIKEIPTISKTTVYNTLAMFFEKGIAHPVYITGTEVRYDGETEAHHHLLCTVCSKIIDIDIACKHFAKGSVAGHEIRELHGYFKGTCRDCLKRKKKGKTPK